MGDSLMGTRSLIVNAHSFDWCQKRCRVKKQILQNWDKINIHFLQKLYHT